MVHWIALSRLLFWSIWPVATGAKQLMDDRHVPEDPLVVDQILSTPSAYDFPVFGGNGSDLFPMRPCRGIQLAEATIDELQAHLSTGTLTSVDLLHCYLGRIFQTDSYLSFVSTKVPRTPNLADIAQGYHPTQPGCILHRRGFGR